MPPGTKVIVPGYRPGTFLTGYYKGGGEKTARVEIRVPTTGELRVRTYRSEEMELPGEGAKTVGSGRFIHCPRCGERHELPAGTKPSTFRCPTGE
jgi:hypothetical protein